MGDRTRVHGFDDHRAELFRSGAQTPQDVLPPQPRQPRSGGGCRTHVDLRRLLPAEQRAGTIVVLGANGGVDSTLVQLARHAGITVIGTASQRHHAALRELGVTPVDYHDPELYRRIREIAPDGVDAVFDHVGGAGLAQSWRLLRWGGALVSYGTAAAKDADDNSLLLVLKLFGRLALWNYLPNGKSARFYNFRAASAAWTPSEAGRARTSHRCCDCWPTVPSPRRSPRRSHCPPPVRRWHSPSRAPSRGRSSSCRTRASCETSRSAQGRDREPDRQVWTVRGESRVCLRPVDSLTRHAPTARS